MSERFGPFYKTDGRPVTCKAFNDAVSRSESQESIIPGVNGWTPRSHPCDVRKRSGVSRAHGEFQRKVLRGAKYFLKF
jgi:hypothetical protein